MDSSRTLDGPPTDWGDFGPSVREESVNACDWDIMKFIRHSIHGSRRHMNDHVTASSTADLSGGIDCIDGSGAMVNAIPQRFDSV
ncbi:MAG: hypothetical protein GY702_02950 [Desulfobulbaceae bacterium]|nr:hypothetical protein [Desulfobulbaceae bacterium]